jgi:hypothetical protein
MRKERKWWQKWHGSLYKWKTYLVPKQEVLEGHSTPTSLILLKKIVK